MGIVFKKIAGVDEVGRGPLAGPVIAAAVILDPEHPIEGLKDSKLLSEKQREILFPKIIESCIAYSLGRAEVTEIDTVNIYHASLLAMQRAVLGLSCQPYCVFVDGNAFPDIPYPVQSIIQGDQIIQCISAASIIAKVTRDREMLLLHEQYPLYGFANHKGYATTEHRLALQQYGACEIHRRSFAPVREVLQNPF